MNRAVIKITAVLILAVCSALAGPVDSDQPRKIRSQVRPVVPDMARRMNLRGTVRLEIEIAADGTVKSTKALGGHPILIQSAEQAIRKWRYEPGPPSKTVVEFIFHQE